MASGGRHVRRLAEHAREITVLDPCMGSGHFLVFALPILVAFRMTEEKLSREDAVRCGPSRQSFRAGDRPALHADRGVQPGARRLANGRSSPVAATAISLLWPVAGREQGRMVATGGTRFAASAGQRSVRRRQNLSRNKSGQALNRSTICSNGRRGWGA